jgi:predicted dehydrogenase
MFEDLRILLAGCGSVGKRHARVLQQLGVKHLLACDPDQAQLESLLLKNPTIKSCEAFSAGLSSEPDAVFILTPPRLHVPMAIEAVSAGCHVFCEKPISDSLEGIDNLAALAQERGKQVMIGLCFRFHEGILKAKDLIDGRAIGRVISIRALMGEHLPDVRPDYKSLFSSRYSGAFDLMHDLDLALWYANQPVRSAKGLFGGYSDIGIDAPDLVEILIDFDDRCMATVHLDFFQRPRRRQIELIGTEGVICVEFARWDEYTVSLFKAGEAGWKNETCQTNRDSMFLAEDRAFLLSLNHGRELSCGIEEACKSLRVILAIQHETAKSR